VIVLSVFGGKYEYGSIYVVFQLIPTIFASEGSCTNFEIQSRKRRVVIDSMFGGVLIASVQYIASLPPPMP